MKYPSEIYRQVESIISERRQMSFSNLVYHENKIKEDYPEIWSCYIKLYNTGVALGKAFITNNQKEQDKLIKSTTDRKKELETKFTKAGLSENYLETSFYCMSCKDTGYTDGKFCECRISLLNQYLYKTISHTSQIDSVGFDVFDLRYYPESQRARMARLLEASIRYADTFSSSSTNLLFEGAPGLGKTHLALSIAKEVVNKGKFVLYGNASGMISRIVDGLITERGSEKEYRSFVYDCELLVIDDLGTEFKTSLGITEVYSLIDYRLTRHLPTIISTNLSIDEIGKAYTSRVASRLTGEYVLNKFIGTDIRYQKKLKK